MTSQSGYYLGMDGGGTKTGGALVDSSGALLATCHDGPSSIVGAPSEEACRVLQSLVARLCAAAGLKPAVISRIGLGLSGIDFADEIPMQHAALARALSIPEGRLVLVNDGIAALWGATPAPAAVILQHGTGFTASFRSAYGREEPFDHLDAGHCYDLRAEALALVARMIDGRAEATPLKDRLLSALGDPPADFYAEKVYRRQITPAQWHGLLPAIFAAGEAGDPAAAALIRHAADDYVCTVGAMIRRTGRPDPDVVFGGGRILLAPDSFRHLLTQGVGRHWPGAAVRRPIFPPAVGAAIMAAFADGCQPPLFFEKGAS